MNPAPRISNACRKLSRKPLPAAWNEFAGTIASIARRPFPSNPPDSSLRKGAERAPLSFGKTPDAHQHIILQKQVYDLTRQVVRGRGGQASIATHSEVIPDATEPNRVIGFLGNSSIEEQVDRAFREQVPQGADLSGDNVSLMRVKASHEFLLPLLEGLRPTPRRDLYLLAAEMLPEEIHPEAVRKLDRIAFEVWYGSRQARLRGAWISRPPGPSRPCVLKHTPRTGRTSASI